MDVGWVKREEILEDPRFFYSFPSGKVEEPLIFPLIVYIENEKKYLLDGHKRFALKREEFPALLFHTPQLTPYEALLISIKANSITRELNSVEKGKIISICKRFFPEKVKEVTHLLNVAYADAELISRIDELEEDFKLRIVQLKIPPKWAAKVCMNPVSWNKVWEKIKLLKFTSSQFVFVINAIYQLVGRYSKEPHDVIEMVGDVETPDQLIGVLKKLLYPVSEKYISILEDLKMDFSAKGVIPDFPENFEGDTATIHITIPASFRKDKLLAVLTELLNDDRFKKLMELL